MTPKSSPALAALIEQTRIERRLSPAEASRQIGVSPTLFSRWRRREAGISMVHLEKVARWAGVPLGQLQVLAGYPSPDGSPDPGREDPVLSDPRVQMILQGWSRFSEERRNILAELARRGAGLVLVALVSLSSATQERPRLRVLTPP